MDINRATMNELFKSYNLIFQRGLEAAVRDYRKFAMEIPSTTAIEAFPFLEQFGGMREWIGDRQIKHLASQKLEITNRDFEDTVAVSRNDIEDDKYGLYSPVIQQLGASAAELWGDLAIAALLGGETKLWLDQLAFFSATRKYGDYTIDNLGTDALSLDAYAAARLKMRTYKGHNGKALKVMPNLLIVGPTNEGMANDIVKAASKLTASVEGSGETAQTIFGTISNPWTGTAEILIDPDLDTEWFLADTSKPLKPLVVQKRKEPKLTRMDSDDSENVFNRKEYIYGTDARGESFLSFPHLIHGSFPSA